MKLPDKYETNIGEHGHKISGGERQRITLARAILKNTPILLMDEPTSALDNKSEVIIQKSLKEYIKKRTLIIVAHKLSSIRFVDKIFVIQNGKVCETGTHDELINQNSVYKQLYMDQIREKSWSND